MSNLWDLTHIQPRSGSVLDGDTIAAMFWNAVAQRGDKVWLREKHLGIWRSWSWTQVGEAVREIAGGLMSLGLAPGDTASILSNTVLEWVLADLAVLSAGGVSNGTVSLTWTAGGGLTTQTVVVGVSTDGGNTWTNQVAAGVPARLEARH